MYSLLFALDSKNGFGDYKTNKLPWSLPLDMKYFRELTLNNTVIYGRGTFESMNSVPLKSRNNIIISSSLSKDSKNNYTVVKTIKEALETATKLKKKVFVIGGKNIIEQFVKEYPDRCETMYITRICHDYKCNINMETPKPKGTYNFKSSESTDFDSILGKDINLQFECLTLGVTSPEELYIDLLQNILDNGEDRKDRTGTGTRSLFGQQIEFNLQSGFPLLTSREVYFKGVIEELLWMLRGETDSKILENKKVNIWKGNTSREFISKLGLNLNEGNIGKGYGHQWRNFGGSHKLDIDYKKTNNYTDSYNSKMNIPTTFKVKTVSNNSNFSSSYLSAIGEPEVQVKDGADQILEVLNLLQNDPYSRRIRFSAWNPKDLKLTVLPPCHCSCDFYVRNIGNLKYLDAKVFQRSCDVFLGAPFNIASYSTLVFILCKMFGYHPGVLYYSLGDSHIYNNHIKQVETLVKRSLRKFPNLTIKSDFKGKTPSELVKEIEKLEYKDFVLENYFPHEIIKGDMAI